MKNSAALAAYLGIAAAPIPLTGMTLNSHQVQPGYVFLALAGSQADGRDFIPMAVERGAALIIAQAPYAQHHSVPIWTLQDLSTKVSTLAGIFWGHPSEKLQVIGVTGTNGKTSVSHFIAQLCGLLGIPCSVLGTLGAGQIGHLETLANTTPDPVSVQAYLAQFVQARQHLVAMEVSSHALAQERVRGIKFTAGIFTNLSAEHLDYHGTMTNYWAAKCRLFQDFHPALALLNTSDPWVKKLYHMLPDAYSYSLSEPADFRMTDLHSCMQGTTSKMVTPEHTVRLHSKLLGRFNAENLMAALAILYLHGIPVSDLAVAVPKVRAPYGRMSCYHIPPNPRVVVDFAHTPVALEQVLKTLQPMTQGQLWCVFGCGGERDAGKRPLMGRVATINADHVIITNDNPRRESALTIVDDIMVGAVATVQVILDRYEAISTAIEYARPEDTILVAGKGHEKYQLIGRRIVPFSDHAVVNDILKGCAVK